ncbi:MAG: hypothetical protein QXU11_10490 [Thermoproteota archaeon]
MKHLEEVRGLVRRRGTVEKDAFNDKPSLKMEALSEIFSRRPTLVEAGGK